MSNKKFTVIIVLMLSAMVTVIFCNRRISGDNLIEYINTENISEIRVQKIVEGGLKSEESEIYKLAQPEIRRFYKVLTDAKFSDLRSNPFAINTNIRYMVFYITLMVITRE